MSTPINQLNQAQNLNKCPHGFPLGACPICSGMGGGVPKDKNKPRKAGEMSYNECMAEWIRMQRTKDAKIHKKELQLEKLQQEAKLYTKILQITNKIKDIANNIIKTTLNIIEKLPRPIQMAIKTIIKTIHNIIEPVLKLITNTLNIINSITEKLSSILGEAKNFIKTFYEKKFKKPIKNTFRTLLSLFLENSQDDDNHQIIKSIFKKLFKKGNVEEDELL